ncbi:MULTISPECIES: winged helix-turn-helix transcriptional regulator [unclassified Methanoculleus]|jgi:DNA-binding HxlR family transcriptional regulator|uniref:Helix-turn-helix domain-containing protein n=1 Tax=Methanoculleus palmolei TaxID=72612 RepID=A0ABD8A986_9EURY|nr:MarR family transcriptional regulator [Methanoculleus sp. UBA377]MDD2473045.1 helix-turn-helix domain-containing protein [Methanoculleus sp.]WOX56069.1 helix-turn-helix domain-containing protein [Methanoculleus palmolei]
MMRTIAKRFSEGGFTLPELARELNMSQETLTERLHAMERLGFITREGCSEPAQTEGSSCHCPGCSCCGAAGSGGVVGYTLTEKGKRLSGKKEIENL